MKQELTQYQQILERKGALWTERSSWFEHWRELSENIMPRTGRFFVGDRNKGDKRHGKIIDETGTRALRVLGAGLMAGMTSPARPWFRLATPDADLMAYEPVKLWLNDVTVLMRDIFARSNTYRSLQSVYEELGCYGTGASIILEDFDDVIRHYTLTAGEYALAANYRGEIDTLYREFDMTVAQIVGEFGIENVSQGVRNLWDTGKGRDQWRTVLHTIEPRTDRDSSKRDAVNMPFKSVYMELGRNDGKFLRESGFKRFPGIAPRWHVSGGDIYGNSPGMEALGSIKQLQHAQLRKGQAKDYLVKPPLQVPTSLKNQPLSTLPGGVSYVDNVGSQNAIRTMWDVRIDLGAELEDIRDIRGRINSTFYVDLFLMLQNDTRSNITAREIAERHEEKLLMLGPTLERLHNELLKPKIDITFDRVLEAGLVPPPPKELNGMELNVEFVSVLAQAQRAVGIAGVDRLLQTVGTIATFQANSGQPPVAMDKLDTDKVIDSYADMLGVDPSIIVGNDRVAIVREQRAQAQAQAQQQAQAAQMAATARDLSQADTSGQNALTDVMSNLTGYGSPV